MMIGTHAYMAMLETDSDGTEVFGDNFCYGINFVEGCASPRQGTGNFVNKNRPSKTTGYRKTINAAEGNGVALCGRSPPSNNTSLSSADSNVVTNDKEFDFLRPVWVLSSELFFR